MSQQPSAACFYVSCFCVRAYVGVTTSFSSARSRGYRGGSPTAVQAWRTCHLWEPSSSHSILV